MKVGPTAICSSEAAHNRYILSDACQFPQDGKFFPGYPILALSLLGLCTSASSRRLSSLTSGLALSYPE